MSVPVLRRLSCALALAVAAALLPAVAAPAPALVSAAVAPAAIAATETPEPARRAARYFPEPGVKINDPRGSTAQRRVIFDHILRSIRSVPRRGHISIATWNFRSNEVMNALIAAHRRNVSVRLVMARSNANPENPNKHFRQLKTALKVGNKKRKGSMKSWAVTCRSSCRGTRGIAHTKLYLFDKVGRRADHVVIFGSHNATDTAARWQWNDVYTMIKRRAMYEDLRDIILEMRKDKRAKPPFREFGPDYLRMQVYPYLGKKAVGDPIMDELNKVTCTGATGGTGINGRTSIKIAQTAMTWARGERLATKLKALWNAGCNVKIIFAMFGNKVLSILRDPSGRGPVPHRRIAADYNGDGYYDLYLHNKVMTISGHYGNDRSAEITWNGSSNFTTTALLSDDLAMRITLPRVRKRYDAWIDRLYANPPVSKVSYRVVDGRRVRVAPPRVDDPYKYVEIH